MEWSPWNCILLTIEEAKAHLKVENLEDVYEKEFMDHIFNKHALARKHFKLLNSYDQHFADYAKGDPKLDESSEYYNPPNKHECDIDIQTDSDEQNEHRMYEKGKQPSLLLKVDRDVGSDCDCDSDDDQNVLTK